MAMKREITFLFLILLIYIPAIRGDIHVKCCGADQHVVENDTFFVCANSSNRYQTNIEHLNFFNESQIGSCIDFDDQYKNSIFAINGIGKITKKENLAVELFPKCCPLGHLYNTKFHSCVEQNRSENIITIPKDSFIKVGLEECDLIFDQILDSEEDFSRDFAAVKIEKSGREVYNGKYCVDSTVDNKYVVRICEKDIQICGQVRCIRKCCPDRQSFVNGANCVDTFLNGVDLHSSSRIEDPDAPFAIIHGIGRPLYVLDERKYHYYLDRAGVLRSYMNKTEKFEFYSVSNESYCIEYAYKKTKSGVIDGYKVFSKQFEHKLETKFEVTRWAKIISCIFLILTILVYMILPKMRNLFGKILVSYCVSTFLFFLCLSFSQFYYNNIDDNMCKFIGFFTILASIWSFTWLHIMCIDIWFSFGTPRTLAGPLQKNEWKRLFQYSLYGWGFPFVWILMIAFISTHTIVPEAIHPYVGYNKCYMENSDSRKGNYAYLLYITLPLLIQQTVNTILFIKTILYCLKIKAEIERMNDTKKQSELEAGKERSQPNHLLIFFRLRLIMKLAVIMGVSFLFETASSLYNFQQNSVTKYIEVVWDTINCLQGVFIFFIFICKKKVYNSIREKIISRKTSVSSVTTTQVSLQNMNVSKKDNSVSTNNC